MADEKGETERERERERREREREKTQKREREKVSERDRVKDWMRLISIDNILQCAPCSIVYWQCICMSRHIYRCIQRCHYPKSIPGTWPWCCPELWGLDLSRHSAAGLADSLPGFAPPEVVDGRFGPRPLRALRGWEIRLAFAMTCFVATCSHHFI